MLLTTQIGSSFTCGIVIDPVWIGKLVSMYRTELTTVLKSECCWICILVKATTENCSMQYWLAT